MLNSCDLKVVIQKYVKLVSIKIMPPLLKSIHNCDELYMGGIIPLMVLQLSGAKCSLTT